MELTKGKEYRRSV